MSVSFQDNRRFIPLPKLENYTKAEWLENLTDINEDYEINEELGFGSYGIVYRAIEKKTNEIKALKVSSKYHSKSAKNYQEVIILSKLDHPNIVHLFKTYETNKRICLILEFCPGSLANIIKERQKLDEKDARQILKYLGGAVDYIHQIGIVHRDLKIENILLSANPNDPNDKWYVKLIDFGLSAFRKPSSRVNTSNVFDALCGTIQYMAPELVTQSYSRLCDVWSLGVICYRLVTGKFPYNINKDESLEDVKTIIERQTIDFDLECTVRCINLLKNCLKMNPAYRFTAGEILIDPWITGKVDNEDTPNIFEMMDSFNKQNLDESKSEEANVSKKKEVPKDVPSRSRSRQSSQEVVKFVFDSSEIVKVHRLLPRDDEDTPKVLITSSDSLKQRKRRKKAKKIINQL